MDRVRCTFKRDLRKWVWQRERAVDKTRSNCLFGLRQFFLTSVKAVPVGERGNHNSQLNMRPSLPLSAFSYNTYVRDDGRRPAPDSAWPFLLLLLSPPPPPPSPDETALQRLTHRTLTYKLSSGPLGHMFTALHILQVKRWSFVSLMQVASWILAATQSQPRSAYAHSHKPTRQAFHYWLKCSRLNGHKRRPTKTGHQTSKRGIWKIVGWTGWNWVFTIKFLTQWH